LRLQMTANYVRKAEKMNFLPEIQSKITTNCDNSGPSIKHGVLGGYVL